MSRHSPAWTGRPLHPTVIIFSLDKSGILCYNAFALCSVLRTLEGFHPSMTVTQGIVFYSYITSYI